MRISNKTLLEAIVKCATMLRSVGETFWSDRLEHFSATRADEMRQADLDEILSWYGGMGSLNDLVICQQNGHQIANTDEDKVNRELADIRERIYQCALALGRAKE